MHERVKAICFSLTLSAHAWEGYSSLSFIHSLCQQKMADFYALTEEKLLD